MARYPHRWPRPLGRPATWEDLDDVPQELIGEIVAGEIVVTPRPDVPHARATSDLGTILGGPFRMGIGGPGGWMFLDEPRIRFGEEIRVPDLAGWRTERWRDVPRRGPITTMPDWICEVLSRSTETEDRARKMPMYARARIPHLWLVNPDARTLEVYRRESQSWLLVRSFADDARVRAEPFDAIEFDLSLLWEPADDDG
jgi:Uma2 family endonuclease